MKNCNIIILMNAIYFYLPKSVWNGNIGTMNLLLLSIYQVKYGKFHRSNWIENNDNWFLEVDFRSKKKLLLLWPELCDDSCLEVVIVESSVTKLTSSPLLLAGQIFLEEANNFSRRRCPLTLRPCKWLHAEFVYNRYQSSFMKLAMEVGLSGLWGFNPLLPVRIEKKKNLICT